MGGGWRKRSRRILTCWVTGLAWMAVAAICSSTSHAQEPKHAGRGPERATILSSARIFDDGHGWRSSLEESGIQIDGRFVLDSSWITSGGADRGNATRYFVHAGFTFDLERLVDFSGATVFASFESKNGRDGSELAGDLQAFSNIDGPDFTQVNEVWWEQVLFDDAVRFKIGKVDANSEFATVDYGGDFTHASMGFSPTIFTLPTYPDPATSVNVFVHPAPNAYLGVGYYDGSGQEGVRTGGRGPSTFFGEPSDAFWIAEAGVRWNEEGAHPGRLAAGFWAHTGTFDRFDGGTESGTEGWYMTLDQFVWREHADEENDEQGIATFAQWGIADGDVSEIDTHFGAGVVWRGAIAHRDDDVLGLGGTWAGLSSEPGAGFTEDGELAFEMFYRAFVLPAVAIQPVLHYILDPGGDRTLDDAFIASVRLDIAL